MQWVHDEQGRIRDAIVLAAVLGSLAVGLLLYSVVPSGGGAARAATPTSAQLPDGGGSSGTAAAGDVAAAPAAAVPAGGTSFGAGLTEAAATAMVDTIVGGGGSSTDDVDGLDTGAGPATGGGAPSTPSAPAAECPTEPVSAAYEDAADQIADAIGQPVPRDNLRLLVEIAAGCSDETPTTPLLGLALDIARLVPSTGLPPVDLSAIPAVPAPEIPQPVIDALEPLNEQVMEACGNVGLLSIIVAVVPSTAGIPVTGSELADLLIPAQTLCAQFEPEYED